MPIAKNVLDIIKRKVKNHIAQGNFTMAKHLGENALEKRKKIQDLFFSRVGSKEHISLPLLEDAIKKEFNCEDDRSIKSQIKLMQAEGRIRVESKVKVWIKQPKSGGAARI